jgi:hypothetical protein
LIDECIPVEKSTDEFKEMIQEAHTYPQTHWDQVARILSKLQNGDCGDQVKGILFKLLHVRNWDQIKRILPKLQKLKHKDVQSSDPKCQNKLSEKD